METGILNGITREQVIFLSKKNNIPVIEGLFILEDLFNADEIFITNSIQEIVPIIYLENYNYPVYNHSITYLLINEYKASIKKAIEQNKGVDKGFEA